MNNYLIVSLVAIVFSIVSLAIGVHPAYALVAGIISFFSAILGFGKMEEQGLLK